MITKHYKTKIECQESNGNPWYNYNIDDNIKVVVTILDFNNSPVIGEEVTLTCDKGYFSKYIQDDQEIDPLGGNSGPSPLELTLKTNSDGQIIVIYAANEWGMVTFSANEAKIQCRVDGWKTIYLKEKPTGSDIGWTIQLSYNDNIRLAQLNLHYKGTWAVAHNDDPEYEYDNIVTIPTAYRPKKNIVLAHNRPSFIESLQITYSNGKLSLLVNLDSATDRQIRAHGMWFY